MKELSLFIVIFLMCSFFISCSEDLSTNADNKPPTVYLVYPNSNIEIYSGSVINIIAEADDNTFIEAVKFFINGEEVVEDNVEPYEFIWFTENFQGTYTIYAKAFDVSGNSSISNMVSILIEEVEMIPYEMVFVQGGDFEMGDHYDEEGNDNTFIHSVTLSDFYMGKYEITHADYINFLNDFGVSSTGMYNNIRLIKLDDEDCPIDYYWNEFYFTGSDIVISSSCPVIEVTWYGAVVYCNWMSQLEGLTPCYDLETWTCDFSNNGYRLPTEAEWEYAARGGIFWQDDFRYSGCHEPSELSLYAWEYSNSNDRIHPIGVKLPNQIGLHDMSGNAIEWCFDYYDSDYYSYSPAINPTGPEYGCYRVLRGGSWHSFHIFCTVAVRTGSFPEQSDFDVGFRLARNQ